MEVDRVTSASSKAGPSTTRSRSTSCAAGRSRGGAVRARMTVRRSSRARVASLAASSQRGTLASSSAASASEKLALSAGSWMRIRSPKASLREPGPSGEVAAGRPSWDPQGSHRVPRRPSVPDVLSPRSYHHIPMKSRCSTSDHLTRIPEPVGTTSPFASSSNSPVWGSSEYASARNRSCRSRPPESATRHEVNQRTASSVNHLSKTRAIVEGSTRKDVKDVCTTSMG